MKRYSSLQQNHHRHVRLPKDNETLINQLQAVKLGFINSLH